MEQKPTTDELEAIKTGKIKNLTVFDLTDADLTDADLTDADLTDVDLTGANLMGSTISISQLLTAGSLYKAKLLGLTSYYPEDFELLRKKIISDYTEALTPEGENQMIAAVVLDSLISKGMDLLTWAMNANFQISFNEELHRFQSADAQKQRKELDKKEKALRTEIIFNSALVTGSLSVDAAAGSDTPFRAEIQQIRGHAGQMHVASIYRSLLANSEIRASHQDCERVQDPYSLRCQPQVMGACFDQMQFIEKTLLIEANAVSDNPLVFAEQQEILSGGNFHAEPVAMASDNLALVISEIGNLAERRIALLTDPQFTGLPAFLVNDPGINSGFMLPHVTAASLASENKTLAHPACVDNIPTSANQEDHVSMATFAARRLHDMNENTLGIIAIEWLAAAQGICLRRPLKTSPSLEQAIQILREKVAFYDEDRYVAPDIEAAIELLKAGKLCELKHCFK